MIKIENVDVYGFEAAIRGMRNPMNSWNRSDTHFHVDSCNGCAHEHGNCTDHKRAGNTCLKIGENDLKLMKLLYKGGTEHRKYLRMINVTMDITCNHFWWAEFDTYKVGTVRNSCSKMHKIHVKEFVKDDFSHEGIDACDDRTSEVFDILLIELERLRNLFNKTQEKKYWRAIIELLPMGYNIKATVQLSYETIVTIIRQRNKHKVDEWVEYVKFLKTLPYVKELVE